MTEQPRCAECGRPYIANRPWQRFCSYECQGVWHARDKREMRQAWRGQQQRDQHTEGDAA